MVLKVALRNIRRSLRDYAIYFITIVFGVAIFYAFNSIGSQEILFEIASEANTDIFELTSDIMGMFSIVIAFVLGFLVIYANQFLIRRRKREFGLYLALGMRSGSVSRLVLAETVIVGVASLAVGLLIGVALSQALSFVTAALFGTTLNASEYQFVFSPEAFCSTLASFVVIYVIVAIFNTAVVSKAKLVDLMAADRKNERSAVRNPWVCLVVFLISLVVIACSYWQLDINGFQQLDDVHFVAATVLMLVGTLLLFWSLAGFVIAVLTRARGVYLRGLVPFVTRQVASRINTAFASLWAVCVILFFSITTFSCGMGLVQVFAGSIEDATPYDSTLRADVFYEDVRSSVRPESPSHDYRRQLMSEQDPETYALATSWDFDVLSMIRTLAPEFDSFAEGAQLDVYEMAGVTYGSLAGEDVALVTDPSSDASVRTQNVCVVGLSQYNASCALVGKRPIELESGQFAIGNTMEATQEGAETLAKAQVELDILDQTYAAQREVLHDQMETNAMLSTALMLIVPDEAIDALKDAGAIPFTTYVNVVYKDGVENGDAALSAALSKVASPKQSGVDQYYGFHRTAWPLSSRVDRTEMIEQAGGLRMLITYLAVYIGFVFLMATSMVLAIQQLSNVADSTGRYRTLFDLGCDLPMIDRALFVQVAVYFLAPLLIAVCHAACAISVISGSLFDLLGISVSGPIGLTVLLVAVVYGAYFLVTFLASRAIVRSAVQ